MRSRSHFTLLLCAAGLVFAACDDRNLRGKWSQSTNGKPVLPWSIIMVGGAALLLRIARNSLTKWGAEAGRHTIACGGCIAFDIPAEAKLPIYFPDEQKVIMANLFHHKFSIAWAAAGAAGLYFAAFWWMVYASPLSYSEMDFDHDGRVSFFEVDYASSYGEHAVQQGGKKCVEFYALKDGVMLKVECLDERLRMIAEKNNG